MRMEGGGGELNSMFIYTLIFQKSCSHMAVSYCEQIMSSVV